MNQEEENSLNIGVIGIGYVGGSIYEFFSSRGENVIGYDKKESFVLPEGNTPTISAKFDDLIQTDFIFLCLPTPYIENFGFDYAALEENLLKLSQRRYNGIVVIKSTVEPGTTRAFAKKYQLRVVHNPEFLTARTALRDFENQNHVVIGGFDFESCQAMVALYQKHLEAQYTICDAEQAELMKLFCNVFYSTKVQIFNEFALLCKRLNIDYNNVKNSMLRNGWINEMHTSVPGPDGKYSYGGACFVKDTKALRDFMERNGVPNEVIKATASERDKMRDD